MTLISNFSSLSRDLNLLNLKRYRSWNWTCVSGSGGFAGRWFAWGALGSVKFAFVTAALANIGRGGSFERAPRRRGSSVSRQKSTRAKRDNKMRSTENYTTKPDNNCHSETSSVSSRESVFLEKRKMTDHMSNLAQIKFDRAAMITDQPIGSIGECVSTIGELL